MNRRSKPDGSALNGDAKSGTSIAVVICAAGASARMGGVKKEYRPLPGSDGVSGRCLTVLGAAVSAFAAIPEITTIVIVVPADSANGEAAARNALPPELLAKGSIPVIRFVAGGVTRQASVYNALRLLADEPIDYVLVHDGARPWLSPSLINRVIAAVKKHQAVIPLLPLTETPKETDVPLNNSDDSPVFIKQHLKRMMVGVAQTPQAFAFSEIFVAHAKAAEQNPHYEFTDDAELWATFNNVPVAAILGEVENRKITFPEDLC